MKLGGGPTHFQLQRNSSHLSNEVKSKVDCLSETGTYLILQLSKKENNTYQATTWKINFNLDHVDAIGTYKLRVALASIHYADLQRLLHYLRFHEFPFLCYS
ncbi:unnamed protein product [Lupinus luteus]|uniref:Uncharacterized protein n=1 Tax=Lupinus luteus TaxID=3873 RepID=A0AAV1XC15_LUPLU